MQDIKDNHPLDLSYLINMVGHNPTFMIEVFDTFIDQTPIYLAELDNALSASDWDMVANSVHKIKPTFSYIGRDDIKGFVQGIEHDARNKENVEGIPVRITRLKELLGHVYLQLEEAKKDIQAKL
ncbi:Hpt domain-containing protein [Pedobacter punctiformis]|uniref:Hpt domain-containing protein n=1 Tax=Pedobacter punctiformis TaxID=3004097 RepID=A0ABT4L8Q5_9SPHI|nr:Hpt domain-containing protein [Pedobacter sp. HCMS5-2]MCZ4244309.1 Hpt domain-containing protein [Pedobacter sp. HCMS5-2]